MSTPVKQGYRLLVSDEDAQRVTDNDAQALNIEGACGVADTVRTTLGPRGLDKLIVNSFGNVIITNDGATILDEMEVVSPAGSMIVALAITQQEKSSDGTTTAVGFAGELLTQAEELIDQGVHPTSIRQGFHTANEWAIQEMSSLAESNRIDPTDTSVLRQVALTSMTGKSTGQHRDLLADLVVDAVTRATNTTGDETTVDLDRIEIETQSGRGIKDSELIEGVVVNKDPLHDDMDTTVDSARVLLLYKELELDSGDVDGVNLVDPDARTEYLESERSELKRQVELLAETGANVAFFMRGVDPYAAHLLAKKGILGINRIKKSDLEEMRQIFDDMPAPIWNLEELSNSDVGQGSVIYDAAPDQFYVTSAGSDRVTLVLRGSTEHVVDEVERTVTDALHAVASAVSDGGVLPGGGATEIEVARRIRSAANSVSNREQLAIEAYADAIEFVPFMVARNAGLDAIDVLTELRSTHQAGEINKGLDAMSGTLVDAIDAGILDSVETKTTAYEGATGVANLILSIDDVISAGDLTTQAEVSEEELGGYEEDFDTPDMGGMIDPNDWGDF